MSLLIYLDKEWPLEHDAETLFLDTPTDTGELDCVGRRHPALIRDSVCHTCLRDRGAYGMT